eukprot:TRINITY_DN23326_c0_g1_i1.p1 TRINITY_DN23326_c0_g1~~TRINITY_DN23326_c0_g1_i1.p1  ORF type:complete len:909 (+),score=149.01 TRINITY_DN23326_c0_g1_i1:54-2729(+)
MPSAAQRALEVDTYLQSHRLSELFDKIVVKLMDERPANPKELLHNMIDHWFSSQPSALQPSDLNPTARIKARFKEICGETGSMDTNQLKQLMTYIMPEASTTVIQSLFDSIRAETDVTFNNLIDCIWSSDDLQVRSSPSITGSQNIKTPSNDGMLEAIFQSCTTERRTNVEMMKVDLRTDPQYESMSQDLSRCVQDSLCKSECPWEQDTVYAGKGLDGLIEDAKRVKCTFDELGTNLAGILSEQLAVFGAKCVFLAAPVKSLDRAGEKVNVKYVGNPRLLTDAVRGTLVIEATSHRQLPVIYEFLRALIKRSPGEDNWTQGVRKAMSGARARVVHFDDRYIKPLGEYTDWLLLLDVSGQKVELQMNFDVVIQMKELDLHDTYDISRKAADTLLKLSMSCQPGTELEVLLSQHSKLAENPWVRDTNGLTPLHYVAFNGDAKNILALMMGKAHPLAIDNAGLLPINRAVMCGHEHVCAMLTEAMLEKSDEMSGLSEQGKEAILKAWTLAKESDNSAAHDLYKLLCLAVPSIDDQLHYAARAALPVAFKEISSQGADLNWWMQRADVGLNAWPLDEAVLAGSIEMVNTCLDMKCMLNGDSSGVHANPQLCALHYVKTDSWKQLGALLAVEMGQPQHKEAPWGEAEGTPLRLGVLASEALTYGALGAIRVLLDNNHVFDEDALAKADEMMLEVAGRGSSADVELLLKIKAHVDSQDSQAHTALRRAAIGGHCGVLEVLLRARANPNHTSADASRTPVWMAAQQGRLEVLQLLQKAGGDVNKVDTGGVTPALIAAEKGHLPVLKFLSDAGCNFSQPKCNGDTPADVALRNGHDRVVSFLVCAGAPPAVFDHGSATNNVGNVDPSPNPGKRSRVQSKVRGSGKPRKGQTLSFGTVEG